MSATSSCVGHRLEPPAHTFVKYPAIDVVLMGSPDTEGGGGEGAGPPEPEYWGSCHDWF